MQWNAENLFDTQDDPNNEGDDSYTPGGAERWTEGLYRHKLTHLAEVLASLKADVIGLEEIENRRVLEDLAAMLRDEHGQSFPFIIHREGPDHRGIDVALLSRLAPVTNRWLTTIPLQREILMARFEEAGCPLTVVVNHWKSRRGAPELCDRLRLQEAEALRRELDRLVEEDPDLAVVVLGDFNDNCDGPALREGLRSILDLKEVRRQPNGATLYNLHGLLPRRDRGSIYFPGDQAWLSFDSMSVSRVLVDPRPTRSAWAVDLKSYAVVRPPKMVGDGGRPLPFRRVGPTRAGAPVERIEGYSDHFPVRVQLVLRP
ncbi:MAG: endonuclease/exonuclease/phosphatase family protein [Lentisphaerae bacterium]|nr:endonuclease/exonuclease/phosphatase family protein [Lentisphaerota bacterium]